MTDAENNHDKCPKCGSEDLLEIIIDGSPTVEELMENKSSLNRFGPHTSCSNCGYSPTLYPFYVVK